MSDHTSLIRLPDVMARTGCSRSTVYRLIDEGKFPSPVKLTERCSAWVTSEVQQWINQRIALRSPST